MIYAAEQFVATHFVVNYSEETEIDQSLFVIFENGGQSRTERSSGMDFKVLLKSKVF